MQLIGAGRVGRALHEAASARGIATDLIGRDGDRGLLDRAAGTPILLCVRNDDLDAAIAPVPPHRRGDLVFVQNGALRAYLARRGLSLCTRGLLYFAVARRDDPITPGRTNWFTGHHAAACAGFLGALGLAAQEVDWARFTAYEFEKLMWLCVFGLLGDRYDLSVGEVVARHRDDVAALCAELAPVGRASMSVDLPPEWLTERLCDYSSSIPEFRASVKEWSWRNGWLVEMAARFHKATPLHDRLLRETGHLEDG